MAPVAERAGRPLGIVGRIERNPPIRAVGNEIVSPDFVRDIPLRRQWEIVIANLLEVTLLPLAAIYEGDIVLGEGDEWVGFRQVRNDRVRVVPWIEDNICHPRLLPAVIDGGMTRLAGGGADVAGGLGRRREAGYGGLQRG